MFDFWERDFKNYPGVNYPLMRGEKKVRGKLTRTRIITTDLGTLSFRTNQTNSAKRKSRVLEKLQDELQFPDFSRYLLQSLNNKAFKLRIKVFEWRFICNITAQIIFAHERIGFLRNVSQSKLRLRQHF